MKPSEMLSNQETSDAVRGLVEQMPENLRIVLLLSYFHDLTYKEIAEITDVPIGTVMSRIHRGRKALQKALVDRGSTRGLVEAGDTAR